MIPTPGHGSFPSAHATEAYAAATVLIALVERWDSFTDRDNRVAMLRGLAERISVNRTVAGVHYPIDSCAGAVLGTAIGEVILGLCGHQCDQKRKYSLAAADQDFFDQVLRDDPATLGIADEPRADIAPSPHFRWMWDRAVSDTQKVV
jgi:hypothetical protein